MGNNYFIYIKYFLLYNKRALNEENNATDFFCLVSKRGATNYSLNQSVIENYIIKI